MALLDETEDMRNQNHYSQLNIEPADRCKADLSQEGLEGAYTWNIEKYLWRDKGQKIKDAKKIQVYARWLELLHDPDQIDEDKALYDLMEQIPKDKYTCILTVGRGGLYVAARVAYHLNIEQVITYAPLAEYEGSVLFVDDIADTGKTIKSVCTPNMDTAVLVKRHSCEVTPTYAGTVVDHDKYIKFKFQGYN